MSNEEVPWSQCRIAFSVLTDLSAEEFCSRWEQIEGRPPNWELTETYFSPVMSVVVFDVSTVPTIEEGRLIANLISNIEGGPSDIIISS